ncbi:unnamed protein product [Brassica napus]|uniref:(rape) hypothetical protein n=1 Tax=Brassica napus TaxID=3708 RepID=A0A816XUW2_BRANA|nr:unnamed protein product [Brassica napus]
MTSLNQDTQTESGRKKIIHIKRMQHDLFQVSRSFTPNPPCYCGNRYYIGSGVKEINGYTKILSGLLILFSKSLIFRPGTGYRVSETPIPPSRQR